MAARRPGVPEFEEPEKYQWPILTKENWNKEAVLGWRYTAAQLAKLGETRARRPGSAASELLVLIKC